MLKKAIAPLKGAIESGSLLARRWTGTADPKTVDADAGVLADFAEVFERSLGHGDHEAVQCLLDEYRSFQLAMEARVSPEHRRSRGRPLELVSGAESKQFMIDLLPSIQRHISASPRGAVFDVLDVGAGTGHGSNLLASLYATADLGYRMRVVSLDINDLYRWYMAMTCRYVRFMKRNVFDIERTFDIVIASHVIEHLDDPMPFCRRLQEISSGRVFLAAPFEEPEDGRTQGHVWSIGRDFLAELDPLSLEIIESRAWGAFNDPPYRMFIAELEGRGAVANDSEGAASVTSAG